MISVFFPLLKSTTTPAIGFLGIFLGVNPLQIPFILDDDVNFANCDEVSGTAAFSL